MSTDDVVYATRVPMSEARKLFTNGRDIVVSTQRAPRLAVNLRTSTIHSFESTTCARLEQT